MISFSVKFIQAANKPAGYLETLRALGEEKDGRIYLTPVNYLKAVEVFSPDKLQELRSQLRPYLPMPRTLWPMWAKLLERLAKDSDAGIGDVVFRVIGPENSEAFKAWHRKIFGRDCGCERRRDEWNSQFPLTPRD